MIMLEIYRIIPLKNAILQTVDFYVILARPGGRVSSIGAARLAFTEK
jgi:hypothetical protein